MKKPSELTYFNRMLLNTLCIVVRQNKGETHGSWWKIADMVQNELGGPAEDDQVQRMKTHLMSIGFEHLTEGSPLAYFKSLSGDHHFVEKVLLNE